jgi:hypothetical protein
MALEYTVKSPETKLTDIFGQSNTFKVVHKPQDISKLEDLIRQKYQTEYTRVKKHLIYEIVSDGFLFHGFKMMLAHSNSGLRPFSFMN